MNGAGFALLIALYPILTWIYDHTPTRDTPTHDEGAPHG